ncbi:DUF7079 family protein [Sphingobium sp. CR28]|uniref:DUF7079 family protein n=1 Tax=Sphingobium sp. CR28 TaxID=3400272 RepID=UPI003FF0E593
MKFRYGTQEHLPVWTVLSELFLDTSFDEADYDRIAEVLRRSPFRLSELERILREEVSPAFAGNLLSVAGEWERWSQEEVQTIMQQSLELQSATGWRAWIRKRLVRRIIPDDWHPIADRLK